MNDSEEVRQNIIKENIKLSKKILEVIEKTRIKENEDKKIIKNVNSENSLNNINIAFAETYDIIKHSNNDIQSKISPKFMNLLMSAKDNLYRVNIDYEKPLDEQIQHETKVVLGIIYRDYLCTPEKRRELIRNETELLERIEKEKNEKYSVDNLFKNRQNQLNIQQQETIQSNEPNEIIEYKKEKWYEKIVRFFRNLFGNK